MKHGIVLLSFYLTSICTFSQTLPKPVQLPNGWKLTPAGTSFPLGDLPLNMAVSPSSKYIAVTNNGQGIQTIELIDVQQRKKIDSIVVAKLWYGLQFSSDERYLYAAGGHDNQVLKFELKGDKLILSDSIKLGKPWPERIGPSGIAIDEKRKMLYTVTRENKSLYIIDLNTRQVVNVLGLDAEAYDCKMSRDGKELFISCWGFFHRFFSIS